MLMLRIALGLLVVFSSFLLADEKPKPFPLPEDPKAVVISFDLHSGFTLPRLNKAPVMSILADGTVLMPDLYGQAKDIEGKISRKQLQSLLQFCVTENKFFDYDEKDVQARMKKAQHTRQIPQVADAPVSAFVIQLADRRHTASQYALGMTGEFYEDIKELQNLRAIEKKMNSVMNEVRVGGKKGIAKLLKAANAELRKQHPDVKPLTAAEFRGAYFRQGGVLSATFSRFGMTKDGKRDGTHTVASVQVPEDGEPEVTVNVKAK